MSIDVKYDTTPCDGTPGQPWEDFKRRLRNVATRSDDRGFSLADHFDDIDEGGGAIGAPEMPAAPGELRKAQAARRRRQKDAYALLTKHLLHKEHLQHITQNFFQNGRAAYNYLDNALTRHNTLHSTLFNTPFKPQSRGNQCAANCTCTCQTVDL